MTAALQRPRSSTESRSTLRNFLGRPSVIVFLSLLAIIVLAVLIGPAFLPSPIATNNPVLAPPSFEYLMGTDQLGRDYLSRVLAGGRVSLLVGLSVTILCLVISVVVGAPAGYFGGPADAVLVRVTEFFQVIPGLILALVAAALLGSNVWIIVIILAVTMWPPVARIVRAEAMKISKLGYVEASRAAGFSHLRTLWSDVLPNAMPPVLVATTMTVGRAILLESGLSYLGIGDANSPSWGALLNTAQPYMTTGWWLAVFPGLFIFLVVLAVNMLGDALNDVLNPTIGRVK